jgi:hypothetical protein
MFFSNFNYYYSFVLVFSITFPHGNFLVILIFMIYVCLHFLFFILLFQFFFIGALVKYLLLLAF